MRKKTIVFLIFFLLTVGNSIYLTNKFGNLVEFSGLILLLFATIWKSKKNISSLKKDFKIIFFSAVLSIGAFYNNIPVSSKIMIFLSSLLLLNYSKFSEIFTSENEQIKTIGDALTFGMIVNSLIGIFTGTLGLSFGSSEAIVKILFLSGLKIKNYCGGMWLIIYISYYIYFLRCNLLRKHKLRFLILFILLLFSGSKGAIFLLFVFILSVNFKNILKFKEKQGKVFYTCLAIIIIFLSIYIYNNILINIPTYAYRMHGMNKLFELFKSDTSKFLFGLSDVAYADTGYDYTVNMRNYLGWDASVEMAYVNIMIKNGFIGFLVYFKLFKDIIKNSRKKVFIEKNIITGLIVVMVFSGFTETYIASIHYVVGPALFCLVNGIAFSKENYS